MLKGEKEERASFTLLTELRGKVVKIIIKKKHTSPEERVWKRFLRFESSVVTQRELEFVQPSVKKDPRKIKSSQEKDLPCRHGWVRFWCEWKDAGVLQFS